MARCISGSLGPDRVGSFRPSWFMENFSEGPHCTTIRDERAIYTATGTGASLSSAPRHRTWAAAALTAEDAPNSDSC